MMMHPEVATNFEDVCQSLDIEFDPHDSNLFYFTSSAGLF